MKRIVPLIFLAIFLSAPAIAGVPDTCRKELDDTYNITEESDLTIALQNLGLCLELELYPKDVKQFLSRESACIHIAGEEPYSGQRAVELERLNKINSCDIINDDKEKLLKKYKSDEIITRALHDYGNKIYPGSDTIDIPGDSEQEPPPMNMLPQNNNSGGGVI